MKKCFIYVLLVLSIMLWKDTATAGAIESETATIYDMYSGYTEKIAMPSDLPQSFQIPVQGEGVTYRVKSGRAYLRVSDTGLVTPARSYWKKTVGGAVKVGESDDYDYYTIYAGTARISATSADGTHLYQIRLRDYASVYTMEVVDKYIKDNITEGMTDDELADAIARFPACYEYSVDYSDLTNMVIYGKGDCWSSVNAIVNMAKRMGFKAWGRHAEKDPGAGSAHANAMVQIHDSLYELESGYNLPKKDGYRPYTVKPRKSLFSYRLNEDKEVLIWQYDGEDTTGTLEIPASIDGKPVVDINEVSFRGNEFSRIILPDTIKRIGDFAFTGCKQLEEVNIPASVIKIGQGIFTECDKLNTLTFAQENQSFSYENGLLCTKDGRELVTVVGVTDLVVPTTVRRIRPYAMYCNDNLRSVKLPSIIKEIGEACMAKCENLIRVELADGIKKIPKYVFMEDHALKMVEIPATVTQMDMFAFFGCSALEKVYFRGSAPHFGETVNGVEYDRTFYGNTIEAYYPAGDTSWDETALGTHDATKMTWSSWNPKAVVSLEDAEITLEKTEYDYTGSGVEAGAVVTWHGKTLTAGTDYVISYYHNVNVGTAYMMVQGCGAYTGTVQQSYTIIKSKPQINVLLEDTKIDVGETFTFYSVVPDGCTYTSLTPDLISVDEKGVMTALAPGYAKVKVAYPGDENYLETSVTVNMWILLNGQYVYPTATPTITPTAVPSMQPTASPTSKPSQTPWYVVTNTPNPTATPSTNPTVSQTPAVTDQIPQESVQPSRNPQPSKNPQPDPDPTVEPSQTPKSSQQPAVSQTPGTGSQPAASSEPTASGKPSQTPKTTGTPSATDGSSGNKTSTASRVHIGQNVTYKNAKYRVTGSNTVTFRGIVKGKSVVIPDSIKINGKKYKVTSIYARACRKNTKITKLVIGKNIQKIGKEAFLKCRKLKTIQCKTSLLTQEDIEDNVFKGIAKKAVLKAPKGQQANYKKWFGL